MRGRVKVRYPAAVAVAVALAVAFVPTAPATAPIINVPSDLTSEATSSGGASVSFDVTSDDPEATPTCDHASGETFQLGQTTVTCSATNADGETGTGSFTITVRDTAAPTISVPGDATIEAASAGGATHSFSASANDTVDGPLTPNCSPDSGSTFPLGTTTVTCSATDAHNNSGSASFHVTVRDTTDPDVNVPGDTTIETASAGGAAHSFSASATDTVDGPLTPSCSPASGSNFPLGTTTITCTATDAHNNRGSDSFKITVVLVDTTAPHVTVPDNATVEATSSSGASYSFTASANDNIDGPLTPSCSPASGSTFPLGTTTITCTATDAHHNRGSASFQITVRDTTAPQLSTHSKIEVEAAGPQGARATFSPPTATDTVDGPIPVVPCTPSSGSTFALGRTRVRCTAADAHGNSAETFFDVFVLDKTPPRLNVPGPTTLISSDGLPLPKTSPGVAAVLASANANDLASGLVAVTNNAPASFPIGPTTVVFTARDPAGNSASAQSTITVKFTPGPAGAPPPPPDTKPPPDPTQVKVVVSSGRIAISWQGSGDDLDHYEVEQQADANEPLKVVYTGAAPAFTASGLVNGTQYRFVILSVDRSGNKSTGVAVIATPAVPALVRPQDGAIVTSPPRLAWLLVPGTSFYNVQLYLLPSLASIEGRKILSAWPTTTSLQLTANWRFDGTAYRLAPGVYRWYVWPGIGARASGTYGPLLGTSAFIVRATKAPAVKKQSAKKKPVLKKKLSKKPVKKKLSKKPASSKR